MASKTYRALVKLEWPDYDNTDDQGRPGVVIVQPGDEFPEPPEHATILELVKHKSAEPAKG